VGTLYYSVFSKGSTRKRFPCDGFKGFYERQRVMERVGCSLTAGLFLVLI
jgi:hypothetical protein